MDLDLLFRLASQLDKETFFEVFEIIKKDDKSDIQNKEGKNLFELLDEYKWRTNKTTELFEYLGISKQYYSIWKSKKRIPEKYVRKIAKLVGISEKEAYFLNFKGNMDCKGE